MYYLFIFYLFLCDVAPRAAQVRSYRHMVQALAPLRAISFEHGQSNSIFFLYPIFHNLTIFFFFLMFVLFIYFLFIFMWMIKVTVIPFFSKFKISSLYSSQISWKFPIGGTSARRSTFSSFFWCYKCFFQITYHTHTHTQKKKKKKSYRQLLSKNNHVKTSYRGISGRRFYEFVVKDTNPDFWDQTKLNTFLLIPCLRYFSLNASKENKRKKEKKKRKRKRKRKKEKKE